MGLPAVMERTRYDGKNFYYYKELSGVSVIYLFYDSQNTLWVCTGNGLFKYNRLTNFFELIVEGYITKLQEDNGKIYFLMVSNIYKLDGNKTVNIYQGNDLSDFCFSKEGIWFSKSNDGVRLLSRESSLKKVVASYPKNKYVSLISKIDDKLFAGCYNGQLYSILSNGKSAQIGINNHYFIQKIMKVGQEIWLATDGNGIIILNINLHFSRTLSRNTNTNISINSNSIYNIYP
jgi:ligand-binding sensor domain-containing protein